jgi:3-phenylpropionate/trans-cinnamate dioxygenase ferredoxin reductase subunit
MQPSKRLISAQINEQSITVEPGETLLQAALRHEIEFPNSCRVGGCGTCKCRLTAGTVKELTETGYLLTADEIDQGYILACQSVPRSDIGVAVDLSPTASQRGVSGHVIAQRKVTHDITSLHVQLDQPMPYKAGQFANVGIDGLDGVVRSYSFAAPARDDGQVSFLVRKVPSGLFSSLVNDEDVVGRRFCVDGPSGDFWLRPSSAPLLLIAGGSGLAPILAILQEALSAGVSRSVTLLFGAREARDLYALEEIESLARQWRGAFRFVPVLSAAGDDATWTGERGLVTEKIPGVVEPGSHALLCGPPAMIDGTDAYLIAPP